ncbi:MAG: S8 family serine peptidase [Candidatus Woesearchaeota archaeon]
MKCIYLVVLIILLCSTAYAIEIDKGVYDELGKRGSASVIVELNDIKTPGTQLQARKVGIEQAIDNTLKRLKNQNGTIRVIHEFGNVNAFVGNISYEALSKLATDSGIKSIHLKETLHIQLADTREQIKADEAQGLELGGLGIDGRGQTVCLLDTGVDYTHENLGGGYGIKVIDGHDYVNNDNDPMDDNGHGTHVAGIIISNHTTYRGIAPGAKIVAVKVCKSNGDCDNDKIIAGMDWCLNNASKYNISAISISIGDGEAYNRSTCPTWMDDALNQARAQNIVVSVSSGNDFNKGGISYPACSPNTTSVGAASKDNSITDYSNTASILDLIAPGGAPGNEVRSTNLGGGFAERFGTSMAAPHVAATVALLKEFYRLQEGSVLMADRAIAAMKQSGTNITDSGNGLVFPLVNAYDAINQLDNRTPIINLSPENGFTTKNLSYTIRATSNEVLRTAILEWNGTNLTMQGKGRLWNYTVTGSTEMRYKVIANDSANNFGISSVNTMTLNDSAPIITNHYPLANKSVKEPLNASFNISYVEPNGQAVQINWYKNNAMVSNTTKYNFPGSYSSAGNYTIKVVLNDSHYATIMEWRLSVNNTNRKPTIAAAWISPTRPGDNSSLRCNNGSITDEDNDNITLFYDWYNGSWRGINNPILMEGNTSWQSRWNCSIKAFDGTENSTAKVSASVIINNTAPAIIASNPADNRISIKEPNNQTFNVTVADNDPITFVWTINGTDTGSQGSYEFKGNYSSKGSYAIGVVAGDGSLNTSRSWTLVVNHTNRQPEQTQELVTQKLYLRENNTINLSLYFRDPDGDSLNYSAWSTNITVTISSGIATIKAGNQTGSFLASINASDGLLKKENSFNVTVTKDKDGDNHNSINSGGDDCNDNQADIYPGASCSSECYSGTYSDQCACTGGRNTCRSSGGGGGGGGSAATKLAGTSRYFDSIEPGLEVRVYTDIAISAVVFATNKPKTGVTISVKESKLNRTEEVYQYLQIDHQNLEESDIDHLTLIFKVNNSWLKDRGQVLLKRRVQNQWERLNTTKINQTAEYSFYSAVSKGLSVFAITAEKRMPQSASTMIKEAPEPQQIITEKPVQYTSEPTPESTQPAKETKWSTSITGVVLTILACIIVISIAAQRRGANLGELDRYLDTRLAAGENAEDIKTKLRVEGWPEEIIEKQLTKVRGKNSAQVIDIN